MISTETSPNKTIVSTLVFILGGLLFALAVFLTYNWDYDIYNISGLANEYNQLAHKTEHVSEIDRIVYNEIHIIESINYNFDNNNRSLNAMLLKLNKVIEQKGDISKTRLFLQFRFNYLDKINIYKWPGGVISLLYIIGLLLFVVGYFSPYIS